MLEEFQKYVSNYDIDSELQVRYLHCLAVMDLSNKYAKKLNFNEYDTKLATLIGLLHDFGRFQQYKIYNSFKDRDTIDHADYSIVQLFDNKLIEKYWDNKEDYELIKFAIKNHNKLKIQDTTNERYLLFAKFIRDMDKLDILRVISENSKLELDDKEISKNIENSFYSHKSANYLDIKSENDELVCILCMAFDINFKQCYEELLARYKKMENICSNNIISPFYKEIYKYLEDNIVI